MKSVQTIMLSALAIVLIACGGNKKPQQNIAFNPGASPEQMVDEDREAKIAAKRAEFNAANADPMETIGDYNGKIKLTVMVPDEGLSVEETKQLESKLIQMVTANGVGGLGGDPRYVIAPEVNVVKKEVTSTAPVRHLIQYDITFYVADVVLGTVFGSSNIKVTGVGDSETLAFLAAFNDLKPNDAQFQQMLKTAQEKIVAYYQEHGSEMIQEAKMLAAQQHYAQAMALLGSIPTEVGETYKEAIKLMDELTPKYLDNECGLVLSQFKAALGQQMNGVNKEAMAYYAMIPANSSCAKEANELYKEYKAKLSAEDQREWDRESAQIKFDNEFKKLQEELQAKIQITGNQCLLDKYKKDAAYNCLPWIRKVVHLGDHDPFDGYTPNKDC